MPSTRAPAMFRIACSFLPALAAGPVQQTAASHGGWPQFRGPNGDGQVAPTDAPVALPLRWSEGENILWKTPIPLFGHSTPVALDGKVWLTTAARDGREFFTVAVDVETGAIILNQRLFQCAEPEPLGNSVNTYASPSAVAEPGRVYLHFGSYGTACLDSADGGVIWARTDLECRHYRGPGSSPILCDDLLILTFDGVDKQYVAALDKRTGKTVWRTDRATDFDDLDEHGVPFSEGDLRKAFSTPLVIEWGGRRQLLSPGSRAMYSYVPSTGETLWWTHHEGFSTSACPVFAEGLAFITTGHGKSQLWAVRVDGSGDVTDTHLAWKVESRDVPQTPSPLAVNGLLFMVSDAGAVTCLEAATGRELWRERLGSGYVASPICAAGHVYLLSQNGTTTVLEAASTYREVAVNRLDGAFLASPAVYGRTLILRSKTNLYRIGSDRD